MKYFPNPQAVGRHKELAEGGSESLADRLASRAAPASTEVLGWPRWCCPLSGRRVSAWPSLCFGRSVEEYSPFLVFKTVAVTASNDLWRGCSYLSYLHP